MPTLHLLIKGRVQGVFYRASAMEVAQKLQITGWIRNTREGHVESKVSGAEEALDQFTSWCRKGPQGAQVTEVLANQIDDEDFDEFSIIRG